MQMTDTFDFIEKENFIHKGIVEYENVITGIGFFFREFAQKVLLRLGYDIDENIMLDIPSDYSEEDLTFYWTEDDYKEFQEELKEYIGE